MVDELVRRNNQPIRKCNTGGGNDESADGESNNGDTEVTIIE